MFRCRSQFFMVEIAILRCVAQKVSDQASTIRRLILVFASMGMFGQAAWNIFGQN